MLRFLSLSKLHFCSQLRILIFHYITVPFFFKGKKESCSTGFTACGGSPPRHNSSLTQCDPTAGRLARALDKLGLKAAHVLKQIDPLGIIDHKY